MSDSGENMKVAHVIGTRPQNIKSDFINEAIRDAGHEVENYDTNQHYDPNLKQYQEPKTVKDWDMEKLDAVVVEGDTHSTETGAIWAKFYCKQLIHLEAGCRSYINMPEEHIRVAVDHLADLRYCATKNCQNNLEREGLSSYVVGDLHWGMLEHQTIVSRPCRVLLTIHREENANAHTVRAIRRALPPDTVFPAHPRVQKFLKIHEYIPPVPHAQMLSLIRGAQWVVTDSGGVQREAYCLKTPCLVLRTVTEWPELVQTGWAKLIGQDIHQLWYPAPKESRYIAPQEIFGDQVKNRLTQAFHRDL